MKIAPLDIVRMRLDAMNGNQDLAGKDAVLAARPLQCSDRSCRKAQLNQDRIAQQALSNSSIIAVLGLFRSSRAQNWMEGWKQGVTCAELVE